MDNKKKKNVYEAVSNIYMIRLWKTNGHHIVLEATHTHKRRRDIERARGGHKENKITNKIQTMDFNRTGIDK